MPSSSADSDKAAAAEAEAVTRGKTTKERDSKKSASKAEAASKKEKRSKHKKREAGEKDGTKQSRTKKRSRDGAGPPKGWKTHPTTPSSYPGALPMDNSEGDKTLESLGLHVAPHLQSFNFFVTNGLRNAIADIPMIQVEITRGKGEKPGVLEMWVDAAEVTYPMKKDDSVDTRLLPAECRERQLYYASELIVSIGFSVDGGAPRSMKRVYQEFPIMVRSDRCHLQHMKPKDLVKVKEEAHEMGGTFICNGIERVIRMLQVPRRNHPMAIERAAFAKKGPMYTSKGCSIRCGRPDMTSITLTLHYLSDGSVNVRFMMEKAEYFIPFIMLLKALRPTTDREIFERAVGACHTGAHQESKSLVDRQFIADRVELMLHDNKRHGLSTCEQHLAYIGARFRIGLQGLAKSINSDADIGRHMLSRFVLVHLGESAVSAKFDLLILMLRKLYAFASEACCADNPDSPMNQELLLPGHLYGMIVKERMEETLRGMAGAIGRDVRALDRTSRASTTLKGKSVTRATILEADMNYMQKTFSRQIDISQKMQYFLATGNLVTGSGLDLMQASGFTVVAEKLNWLRYMAHFRAVHRGAFFSTMKTTTVRKLLPESWGFICPVHTPDGAPCGLLQHIASRNCPVTHQEHVEPMRVVELLEKLGCFNAMPRDEDTPSGAVPNYSSCLPVLLDGRILAWMPENLGPQIAQALRRIKVIGTHDASGEGVAHSDGLLPKSTEIAFFPPMRTKAGVASKGGGPFPGLFIGTAPARMLRPVTNLELGCTELIGPMEQVFMNIACAPEDIDGFDGGISKGEIETKSALEGPATHMETDPMNMLSLIASLTPFSDFNQSPRNMYQCQMGKQTMGSPAHSLAHRVDSKMYRIQTPQAPIVQNRAQNEFKMDEYPNGTNAIVAVITYTGYDMEDAMIINKGSMERGFAHASVYKTKTIDLMEGKGGSKNDDFGNIKRSRSGTANKVELVEPLLDADGLPPVGYHVTKDSPLYVTYDHSARSHRTHKYKESEPAIVEDVRVIGTKKVSIKLRYNRNPQVGDKFATRSGQKGVCSVLWPHRDMPFTESGMVPDILFNPHGFPSRMTIGMMIEGIAGKAGALHGTFQDSTPFRFHEDQRAVDYFGEHLRKAGYNYYGNEPLYSGTSGLELHADIFVGSIYYQRLRHMVSDKSQVRSTGAINSLTRQPIKGRKVGGGIRFGEMERDSLLAHGTSFLLQDRLFKCSDEHEAHVCKRCGSILAPHETKASEDTTGDYKHATKTEIRCRSRECKGKPLQVIRAKLPYVFRYLANELFAMNIRMQLNLESKN